VYLACFLYTMIGLAPAAATAQVATKGMVDDRRLLAANDTNDDNWITFGQDYRNQRFSSLTQINRGNASRLVPA
jgi:glucose dehydrogenase